MPRLEQAEVAVMVGFSPAQQALVDLRLVEQLLLAVARRLELDPATTPEQLVALRKAREQLLLAQPVAVAH